MTCGLGGFFLWLVKNRDLGYLYWPGIVLLVLGMAFVVSGFMKPSAVQRIFRTMAIVFLNTGIIFGVLEVACRVIGVNFAAMTGEKERFEKYPIYFRMPTKPVGDVYFTRPGPQDWTGRVLNTTLQNMNCTDDAYPDEKEITVHYDKDGFRNPDDLKDWEVMIAGDSFTEAGYLPFDQIFTTVLAEQTEKKVKQLGVSYTGSLSQACYLREFGKAPSAKKSVLTFFEGNDLDDTLRELQHLEEFRSSGKRPSRDLGRNTSLFKTLYLIAKNLRLSKVQPRSYANAKWIYGGKKTPISVYSALPGPDGISDGERRALVAGLDAWAEASRELGVEPYLLYLPYKRRVMDGMLEFSSNVSASVVDWQPNKMPEHVESLCKERGIKFINAIPALTEACQAGNMPYNTIYDTHLNREGHRIVGELLAKEL
jgi:hypothetical protein